MRDEYDLIIVGGGLVGTSLYLALAHLPLRIALIEAKSISSPPNDPRSIALSYGSSRILTSLNIWQDLLPLSTPITNIHVSNQGRFGSSVFKASDIPVPALGYITAHSQINQVLLNHLQLIKAEIFAPAQIIQLNKDNNDDWELHLNFNDQSRLIKTKLLIAADGNNSFIRQQQNIQIKEHSYPQSAILTKLSLKHPHKNIAYERFTPDGAIALLPIDANKASVIWTMAHDTAEPLVNTSDEVFLDKLQNAFGSRLGHFLNTGPRYLFPLKMTVANQQIKPGLLLLGNAAQSLHPIAAQGFNLAIKHLAILAELMSNYCHQDKPINDFNLLKEYEKRIQLDRQQTIKFTHYLTKIFSNNIFPLSAFRDSGLLLLDILPIAKNTFAKKCMGIHGKLPRLYRADSPT